MCIEARSTAALPDGIRLVFRRPRVRTTHHPTETLHLEYYIRTYYAGLVEPDDPPVRDRHARKTKRSIVTRTSGRRMGRGNYQRWISWRRIDELPSPHCGVQLHLEHDQVAHSRANWLGARFRGGTRHYAYGGWMVVSRCCGTHDLHHERGKEGYRYCTRTYTPQGYPPTSPAPPASAARG